MDCLLSAYELPSNDSVLNGHVVVQAKSIKGSTALLKKLGVEVSSATLYKVQRIRSEAKKMRKHYSRNPEQASAFLRAMAFEREPVNASVEGGSRVSEDVDAKARRRHMQLVRRLRQRIAKLKSDAHHDCRAREAAKAKQMTVLRMRCSRLQNSNTLLTGECERLKRELAAARQHGELCSEVIQTKRKKRIVSAYRQSVYFLLQNGVVMEKVAPVIECIASTICNRRVANNISV